MEIQPTDNNLTVQTAFHTYTVLQKIPTFGSM